MKYFVAQIEKNYFELLFSPSKLSRIAKTDDDKPDVQNLNPSYLRIKTNPSYLRIKTAYSSIICQINLRILKNFSRQKDRKFEPLKIL